MARSYNHVTIMGNLTRDPELRTIPSGSSVCKFSLALNRSYKDASGNQVEAVDFIDVTAWAALGERVAQYLTKGSQALVDGRLQMSTWEQDGVKRSKVEVVANDVTFVGGRGAEASAESGTNISSPKAQPAPKPTPDDIKIEDLGDEPIDLSEIPF